MIQITGKSTVWILGASMCWLGWSQPTSRLVTVEGRATVLNTGKALESVIVNVGDRTAQSGADGKFEFPEVPVGTYHLAASLRGYELAEGTPKVIKVAGGNLSSIDLKLVQTATIEGSIEDVDKLTAKPRSVHLVQRRQEMGQTISRLIKTTRSDPRGQYRFSDVLPGVYFLFVPPAPGVISPTNRRTNTDCDAGTYYPSSEDLEGASSLRIYAGQALSGVRIKLRAVPCFNLTGNILGLADSNTTVVTVGLLRAMDSKSSIPDFSGRETLVAVRAPTAHSSFQLCLVDHTWPSFMPAITELEVSHCASPTGT